MTAPHSVVVVDDQAPFRQAAKAVLRRLGCFEFAGEAWDSGVCHGAIFTDTEGNGLALHHRYAPYLDGTTP